LRRTWVCMPMFAQFCSSIRAEHARVQRYMQPHSLGNSSRHISGPIFEAVEDFTNKYLWPTTSGAISSSTDL
jgi:hypothetical protein